MSSSVACKKMFGSQRVTVSELEALMCRIPDGLVLPGNEPLTCHVIVYAIPLRNLSTPLEIRNGWFASLVEHSWLEDPKGNVFDVRPSGMMVGSNDGVLYVDRGIITSYLYESDVQRRERITEACMQTGGAIQPSNDPVFIKSPYFDEAVEHLWRIFTK
jgi:hypothetical protein